MAKSERARARAHADLSELERKLSISFGNKRLLERALTHKSFAHESGRLDHNESMEFLGDAVLGFIVTDLVFRSFPELSEGRKSKIKAYLVSAATLASLAVALRLPRYLRLGRGEEKTGGRKKRALSANAFEALLAAIYLDSGIRSARRFLVPLYEPLLRQVREGHAVVEDPKTALQELLQARNLPPPEYTLTAETGPEHRKTFHVELRVGRRKLGTATGPTKKRAELVAARSALEKLMGEEEKDPEREPEHGESARRRS